MIMAKDLINRSPKTSRFYLPIAIGEEENICLSCTQEFCTGVCEHIKKERKRIKNERRMYGK